MMKGKNDRLPRHFRDFIVALNNHDVEYMIIGGYALGTYGHIRATKDLDIFIHVTDQDAAKMVQACIDYGIPERSLQKEMFLVEKMIGTGDPPLRIEILKEADVLDFQYDAQRTKTITIDGVPLKVDSLDDLILLKKAALKDRNVARDAEDHADLQKLKGRT
jgi:predicted nucleotidyltransferase